MTAKELMALIPILRENGASYFRHDDFVIKFDVPRGTIALPKVLEKTGEKPGPSAQAVPPVEIQIPHHVNEVQKLLRLSDTDLVDRMFPDHTQAQDN